MVTSATRNDAEWIASEAFTGWLNSPGHYKNMVEPTYDAGGVGVFVKTKFLFLDAIPSRYDIYVTHLLCKDMTEYNTLDVQYEAAKALLGQLDKRYEELQVAYKAIEQQYVNNLVSTAPLKEAYDKLEVARVQFNTQVDVVNLLVQKMNAAAKD